MRKQIEETFDKAIEEWDTSRREYSCEIDVLKAKVIALLPKYEIGQDVWFVRTILVTKNKCPSCGLITEQERKTTPDFFYVTCIRYYNTDYAASPDDNGIWYVPDKEGMRSFAEHELYPTKEAAQAAINNKEN